MQINKLLTPYKFVDFEGSIWQSVEDKDIAWHCGAKTYRQPDWRNANSIGIEMCVQNKGSQADTSRDRYFEDATVVEAIQLTRELMVKYQVPANHVIRHYDAWIRDDGAIFKGQVTVDGKWYIMNNAGRMIVEPVMLIPDQDGAMQWLGLAE